MVEELYNHVDKLKFEVRRRRRDDGLFRVEGTYEPEYETVGKSIEHRFLFWKWKEAWTEIKPNPAGEKVKLRSAISYARLLWEKEKSKDEPMDVMVVIIGYPANLIYWKNGRFLLNDPF